MSTAAPTRRATCIIVNGPSSGGKSTLCAALQDKLVELADGEQGASFACVAFDDFLGTLSTRYYPHSFTALITAGTTAAFLADSGASRLLAKLGFQYREVRQWLPSNRSICAGGSLLMPW